MSGSVLGTGARLQIRKVWFLSRVLVRETNVNEILPQVNVKLQMR